LGRYEEHGTSGLANLLAYAVLGMMLGGVIFAFVVLFMAMTGG